MKSETALSELPTGRLMGCAGDEIREIEEVTPDGLHGSVLRCDLRTEMPQSHAPSLRRPRKLIVVYDTN